MKLKITKSELQEIHKIACADWAKKIANFTLRNPFGNEIEFSAKEIEEMLSASTKEQLPTVKRIFNVVDTFESIKTLENAILFLGESDEEVKQLRVLQSVKISDRILAQQEAVCFVRALNDRVEFDWKDSSQEKYRIWWYMDSFRFYFSDWFGSSANVAASLCFKSKKLADFAGNNENYKNICKRFMY